MKFAIALFTSITIGIVVFSGAAAVSDSTPAFEPLRVPHPRILIFSPHPDDDVLGASGVMKAVLEMRAKGADADLRVVYVTMGDSYGQALKIEKEKGRSKTFVELGEERHKEALNALQAVGVGPDKAIFLGFPDQSLMPLFSLPKHSKKLYTSPAEVGSKVAYSFAVHPGEPFLRDNLVNEIAAIIKGFKPTAVFTPTLTDCHPDHRGTREFVSEVLANLKSKLLITNISSIGSSSKTAGPKRRWTGRRRKVIYLLISAWPLQISIGVQKKKPK